MKISYIPDSIDKSPEANAIRSKYTRSGIVLGRLHTMEKHDRALSGKLEDEEFEDGEWTECGVCLSFFDDVVTEAVLQAALANQGTKRQLDQVAEYLYHIRNETIWNVLMRCSSISEEDGEMEYELIEAPLADEDEDHKDWWRKKALEMLGELGLLKLVVKENESL